MEHESASLHSFELRRADRFPVRDQGAPEIPSPRGMKSLWRGPAETEPSAENGRMLMTADKGTSEIVAAILAGALATRAHKAPDPAKSVKLYLEVKEELEKALAPPPKPPPEPGAQERLRRKMAELPPRDRSARSR